MALQRQEYCGVDRTVPLTLKNVPGPHTPNTAGPGLPNLEVLFRTNQVPKDKEKQTYWPPRVKQTSIWNQKVQSRCTVKPKSSKQIKQKQQHTLGKRGNSEARRKLYEDWFCFSIYLKEGQGGQTNLLNAHNSQGWIRIKSGTRNSIQICVSDKTQPLKPSADAKSQSL